MPCLFCLIRNPVLLLVLVLGTTAACGPDRPEARAAPLGPDAVVLAFGDSLTQGLGAAPEQSYPAQLARLTGLTVMASGLSGETSAQGLARLPRVLEQTRPDMVILCHGGNDLLQRLPEDALAANLRAMIRLARDRGAQVVLVGVPSAGLSMSTAQVYGRVAQEENVPLEDRALAAILADKSLKSDFIHPNAAGYACLAQAVDRLLRSLDALSARDRMLPDRHKSCP